MVDPTKLQLARQSLTNEHSIQRVLAIGAGWVGRQIVGQLVSHGLEVVWCDNSTDALKQGRMWLQTQLPDIAAQGFLPEVSIERLSEIVCVDEMTQVTGPIDLAIESVSEQVSSKRRVLSQLSEQLPVDSIIASNSSYFTPSILERYVSHPERFVHYHFHVPVWRTKLVDIAAGPSTDAIVIAKLEELSRRIQQHPLTQTVENSGYVFNAMLKSVIQSALQLVQKGVASPDQIDLAWKSVMGMPIGPFGMMDQIGLDLVYQTMATARFVDGDAVWQPLMEWLEPYVQSGKLGVKSSEGIYKYD